MRKLIVVALALVTIAVVGCESGGGGQGSSDATTQDAYQDYECKPLFCEHHVYRYYDGIENSKECLGDPPDNPCQCYGAYDKGEVDAYCCHETDEASANAHYCCKWNEPGTGHCSYIYD